MDDYIHKPGLIEGDLQHPVALRKGLTQASIAANDLSYLPLFGNLFTPRGIDIRLDTLWRLPRVHALAL